MWHEIQFSSNLNSNHTAACTIELSIRLVLFIPIRQFWIFVKNPKFWNLSANLWLSKCSMHSYVNCGTIFYAIFIFLSLVHSSLVEYYRVHRSVMSIRHNVVFVIICCYLLFCINMIKQYALTSLLVLSLSTGERMWYLFY